MPGSQREAEKLFLKFAASVSDELELREKESKIPLRPKETVVFGEAALTLTRTYEPDYWAALQSYYDHTIYSRPEVNACVKEHLDLGLIRARMADNEGNLIEHPTYEQLRWPIVRQLLKPFMEAATIAGSARPSESQLLESYQRYRELLWLPEERSFDFTAPLVDLNSDVDEIELAPGIRLKPLSLDEKGRLFDSPLMAQGLGTEPIGWRYAVTGTFRVSQTVPSALVPAHFEEKALELITLLRLLHRGEVGLGPVFQNPKERLQFDDQRGVVSETLGRGVRSGRYELNRSELPALLELRGKFDALRRSGRSRELDVALRRFNLSYQREMGEDRLIDLTIALESSLLAGSKDELSYRLSLLGAAMLAGVRTPSETYELLQTIYATRSRIVHDGLTLQDASVEKMIRKLPQALSSNQFVEEAEEAVRLILRRYVDRLAEGSKGIKEINHALEQQVLNSLTGTQPPTPEVQAPET